MFRRWGKYSKIFAHELPAKALVYGNESTFHNAVDIDDSRVYIKWRKKRGRLPPETTEVIMEVNIGRAKFSIVLGDITKSGTEAIANSANDKLWMGSGVAGAIKKRGGEEIELEAMKKGPIPIGEVAITSAGNLSAKKVIHAVVMGQDLKTSEEYVRNATRNTLIAAEGIPVSSLAMPAFGTGVGHFHADDCSRIMVEETVNALLEAKNLTLVKIVLEDNGTFEIFKKALEARFRRK